MNLILLEQSEVDGDGIARLAGARAVHIREVLKAIPGQHIRVGLIEGPCGYANIHEMSDRNVVLQCRWENQMPSPSNVDLLLALPRPKVMRRLWAQLAALGVGQIILTNAYKVERDYFDTHVLRPETYRPLLIEGLQQGQDTLLPKVSIHKQLKVLIEDDLDILSPVGKRLLADPNAKSRIGVISLERDKRALIAVGPEGGWTDYEKDLFQQHGFYPVSMGPRTLRADTACVALLALMNDALGAPK